MIKTYKALQVEGRLALERAGVPSATLDARVLLEFVTGQDRASLLLREDAEASASDADAYAAAIEKRVMRVPVAYITGVKEFWSLEFKVNEATLIPRPESEHLVEEALKCLPKVQGGRLLDLGTGSGCLLVSILSERADISGVGVDRSLAALAIAQENARRLGVANRADFVQGNWADAVAGPFDVVVANPPYLTAEELRAAPPEVRDYEPSQALCPGTDGLAAYRQIAAGLIGVLKPGGFAALEIGADQAISVRTIIKSAGLNVIAVRSDLAGRSRVLVAQKTLTNKQASPSKKKLESTP